ncbi:MAG: 4'-phosphopantetheinyl transferase superfamily protein [Prevotella sp.]|nr:4'-phosphopantetheinyl transferase superfamily protein [Prevotella sp.]
MKYFIDDRLDEIDLDAALRLMPQWRRERTLAYRREGLRRQSAGAWLLLRRACREVWGLDDVPEISQGEHGKPYFADYPNLHFNLSHCNKGAACAVSDRPVGIDIETLQAPHEQLSRHVLSAAEYDAMMASERPDVSFTRLWTMKESLSKLSGYGLTTDWPRLQHLLDDHPEARFTTIEATDKNYVCTVCEINI